MGDPDLVMQADQAAMALENAWRHWRRRHGLPAESMLPVSSYVGYSPAEPWGQPRVVFGMAAEDAGQLTSMLEGHDCVGPVHARLTSLPGSQADPASASRGGESGGPPPIPHQSPASRSAKPRPARLRPPRRPDPLDPAQVVEFADPHVSRRLSYQAPSGDPEELAHLGYSPAEVADDQDGPVFRQAAAAAASAAAARHAEEAAARLRAVAAVAASGQPVAAAAVPAQTVTQPVTAKSVAQPSSALAAAGQSAGAGQISDAGQSSGTAGVMPTGRFPLPGEPAVPAPRSAGEAGEAAKSGGYQSTEPEPPGPLTLAAAAARAAAEARIKSARLDPRAAAGLEDPYAGGWSLRTGSVTSQLAADEVVTGRETLVLPPSQARPEAASGAVPALAGPLPVYPGLLRVDMAPGSGAGEADDTGGPGPDRRGRLAQFGVPRLPRGRRPGAAPGTA